MRAMILAAGRGERLRPLTDNCPKPLVQVAEQSLIEYHLQHLAKRGISKVVINHAWLGHMLEQKLGDGSRYGVSIAYSAEGKALETGGGINKALPLLVNDDQPFLVINGDIYIDSLPDLSELTLPNGKLAKLFLVDNPSHNPEGDFDLASGHIKFSEHNRFTFTGIGIYHPQLFSKALQGSFPLTRLLNPAIEQQLVCGQLLHCYWCDVGTIERLQSVEQHLQNI